ncbi:ABC transporter permease subunit [Actinomyces sp.]|uniref:ABC transporter permease subunit n=1 Tax=Actinomyces sp. TaxID=29317 RepID=UPI0026DD8FEF|nr:ABC transporter permease subunit [Actinomyces sp.]MDO4899765.1 ABC transporter permease subunit [Actinomyces sp.]
MYGNAERPSRARMTVLIRNEWKRSLRDVNALVPVLLFPLLFSILLPGLVIGVVANSEDTVKQLRGLEAFLERVGAAVATGAGAQEVIVTAITMYVFAPMFLLIPMVVATAGASAAFVGEWERGTLDGLLYGPASFREIFLAKTLASTIPAVAVTWIAFLAFTVIVNAAGWPVMGRVFFPNPTWVIAVAVLIPLLAFVIVGSIVAISNRARSVQSAQGVVVFFFLPLVASIVSQATGAILLNHTFVALTGGLLALLAVLVYRVLGRVIEDPDLVLKT